MSNVHPLGCGEAGVEFTRQLAGWRAEVHRLMIEEVGVVLEDEGLAGLTSSMKTTTFQPFTIGFGDGFLRGEWWTERSTGGVEAADSAAMGVWKSPM